MQSQKRSLPPPNFSLERTSPARLPGDTMSRGRAKPLKWDVRWRRASEKGRSRRRSESQASSSRGRIRMHPSARSKTRCGEINRVRRHHQKRRGPPLRDEKKTHRQQPSIRSQRASLRRRVYRKRPPDTLGRERRHGRNGFAAPREPGTKSTRHLTFVGADFARSSAG